VTSRARAGILDRAATARIIAHEEGLSPALPSLRSCTVARTHVAVIKHDGDAIMRMMFN